MPLLTVFPAAAQVGHGVHAAHLQPHQHRDGEARREADVEAPVAVEVRRIRSVERESLFVRDEHRDPCAILARVEHLLRLVPGRIEVDGGRLEDTRRAALEGVAEDRGGIEEGREGVEHLVVLALAADRPDRPERGKLQVLQHPPIKREQAQPGGGIVHVVRHERVMDDLHPLEHVLALGNELPPPPPLGMAGVDRDDTLAGRVEVGEEIEHGAVVPHERVARIEIVQEPDHLAGDPRMPRILQVAIIDAVPPVRTEPDGQHGVAAVVRHLGVHPPVGLVGPLVHEHVLRLICAEAMIVEPLEAVHVGERLVGGLRVAAIEKARPILRPRRPGKLDPLEMIGQVARGDDVAHAKLLPVRPARCRAIREQPTVVGDRQRRERHRPVFGEDVRIEQRLGGRLERRLLVQNRLILQPVVLEEEVAARLPERRAVLRIVPELREPLADRGARGDLREIGGGEPVLRLDPGAAFGRVRVLEPAVRIRDSGPVVIVDDIALASGRILECLGRSGHGAREHACQEETPREGTKQRSGHLPDKSRDS